MRCGNCKQSHETVDEVRSCYQQESKIPLGLPSPQEHARAGHPENRYGGKCRLCGSYVQERAGHIEKVNGKWCVFHNSGDCVSKAPAQVQASTDKWGDIPEGYFATESITGNNDLDFWRVDRPGSGKWAGYMFVKRVTGGHPAAPVKGDTKRQALQAIRDAGPEKAKARYGQEIGKCGECNRLLTDETSRALGIGPVCRSK